MTHHTLTPHSILARVSVIAATLALFALAFAPAAGAAPSNVTYVELGPGFNEVFDGQDAGSYLFTIDGESVTAYCADIAKTFNGDANFALASSATSDIPNLGAAAWVAKNASSIGTPVGDENAEHAAIQIAVWNFTNGVTINDTTVTYEPVRARALELVAAVGTNTIAPGPASYNLALTGAVEGANAVFTATLTDNAGNPLPGQTVEIAAPGGAEAVTTNDAGVAVLAVPAPAAGATVDAEAAFSGVVPAGTLIVPDDDSQPLITSEDLDVALTATASATTPAAGETPPPPPANQPPAAGEPPAATPPVEELPYTGGNLGWPHLAAALVALGVSGVVIARLRKTHPVTN